MSSSVESHGFIVIGEKSRTFKLYLIAFQNNTSISCFAANCATTGVKSSTLNIFCIANSTPCFLSFIYFCNNFDIGLTKGKKMRAKILRRHIQMIVNHTTIHTLGSNTDV